MPYTTQLTTPITNGTSTKTAPTIVRMFFPRRWTGFKYKMEITPVIEQIYTFQPTQGGSSPHTVGAEVRCIVKTYKRNVWGGWSLNSYSVQITDKVELRSSSGIIRYKDDIDITHTTGNPKSFKLFSNFVPNPTSPAPDILYNQQFWTSAMLDIKIKLFTSDGDFEVDYV